jgi:hypothetical protein
MKDSKQEILKEFYNLCQHKFLEYLNFLESIPPKDKDFALDLTQKNQFLKVFEIPSLKSHFKKYNLLPLSFYETFVKRELQKLKTFLKNNQSKNPQEIEKKLQKLFINA